MSKTIPVQEYADGILNPAYRQPVKTLRECLEIHGWQQDVDRPICCGSEVKVTSFLGDAYFAQCDHCRKFVVDVMGPSFGNASVNIPDDEKIIVTDGRSWVAGTEA